MEELANIQNHILSEITKQNIKSIDFSLFTQENILWNDNKLSNALKDLYKSSYKNKQIEEICKEIITNATLILQNCYDISPETTANRLLLFQKLLCANHHIIETYSCSNDQIKLYIHDFICNQKK